MKSKNNIIKTLIFPIFVSFLFLGCGIFHLYDHLILHDNTTDNPYTLSFCLIGFGIGIIAVAIHTVMKDIKKQKAIEDLITNGIHKKGTIVNIENHTIGDNSIFFYLCEDENRLLYKSEMQFEEDNPLPLGTELDIYVDKEDSNHYYLDINPSF